jgi:hypothetical protein
MSQSCVCVCERQNLLEGKALFLGHSQGNLQNIYILFALSACLFVCCAHVRIQEQLDWFLLHSIFEGLKNIVIFINSDNINGNMT